MAAGIWLGPRDDGDNHPSKLTRFDYITCVFAAMGGLMFGYDIGISGIHAEQILTFFLFAYAFNLWSDFILMLYFLTCSWDKLTVGGVTSMADFLKKFFPTIFQRDPVERSGNQYCKFNSHTLTLFTSSLYLAALASSLIASCATRRFGRKISMLIGGLVFLAGAVFNVLAMQVWMLIVGRLLLGLGVGFAIQVYIQTLNLYIFMHTCLPILCNFFENQT